jgi:hypothetical protein
MPAGVGLAHDRALKYVWVQSAGVNGHLEVPPDRIPTTLPDRDGTRFVDPAGVLASVDVDDLTLRVYGR